MPAAKETAPKIDKVAEPAVETQPSVTTKEAEATVIDEETELGKKEALIAKLREERESSSKTKRR